MVLTGTNFDSGSSVFFGDVPAASFTVLSSTSIEAYSPVQAASTVYVRVAAMGGISAPSNDNDFVYSAASAPSITSISPSSGSAAGGTVITLIGTNFTGATAVTFGTTAAGYTVHSATRISTVVPAGASGSVSVTVTTGDGTTSGVTFTRNSVSAPAVTGLSVTGGSTAGGTEVTVLGSGFTSTTAVKFGTDDADSITVLSDTSLRVRAPAHAAGQTDITVVAAGGTSSTSSASHYTYAAPSAPTVTAVSPDSGVSTGGGAVITITGTNFSDVSEVLFGSIPAQMFLVQSSTQITAVAPAQAAAVYVQVVTPGGMSATSSSNDLAYSAASARRCRASPRRPLPPRAAGACC